MLLNDKVLDALHDEVAGLLHQLAEHRHRLRRSALALPQNYKKLVGVA